MIQYAYQRNHSASFYAPFNVSHYALFIKQLCTISLSLKGSNIQKGRCTHANQRWMSPLQNL